MHMVIVKIIFIQSLFVFKKAFLFQIVIIQSSLLTVHFTTYRFLQKADYILK